MATIIVTSGPKKGKYYPLFKRTNVIGRDEALPIQILDELVSRKHLRIYFEKDKKQYYAFDMKSKHGVFINGEKIDKETVLAENDQIRIGSTTLLFTEKDIDDSDSGLNKPKLPEEKMHSTQ